MLLKIKQREADFYDKSDNLKMRVISGKFKGKKLFSPNGNNIRPTTDRIKETLFNMLFSLGYPEGCKVLDLFSGSGALGIEALSRGAESAVFTDREIESVRLTEKNLKHVKASGFEVYNADFKLALKKLSGRTFDIIFADPPYNLKIESEIITEIMKYGVLHENGIIIIEHSKENKLQNFPESLIINERVCGGTVLCFLKATKE